ncbi:hypothetical protein KSC_045940 [Ktedonobacter sp. SOSP1-52]|nr:hypothetical protein KSC_045940 [Ktedonobacter sp. SOSP1-52]
MGVYIGQLPPAEIARLKAELAETLIANFCYPRFFDHRKQALCTRPVDRAKRQEVWLYLSSFDFTTWGRLDLMSVDLQHQVERLFIQFVQRNRSFFGEQGRRRMADIRMLINTCASSVVQNLRLHISGQKQLNPPFGSPRPVVSWSAPSLSGKVEPGWEQIAASTMQLQQQLQELRGEPTRNAPPAQTPTRGTRSGALRAENASTAAGIYAEFKNKGPAEQEYGQAASTLAEALPPTPHVRPRPAANAPGRPAATVAPAQPTQAPQQGRRPPEPLSQPVAHADAPAATRPETSRRSGPLAPPTIPPSDTWRNSNNNIRGDVPPASSGTQARRPSTSLPDPRARVEASQSVQPEAAQVFEPVEPYQPQASNGARHNRGGSTAPSYGAIESMQTSSMSPVRPEDFTAFRNPSTSEERENDYVAPVAVKPAQPSPTRSTAPAPIASNLPTESRESNALAVGDDDIAIFEQMRQQLVVWLRIEVITSGQEIDSQGPVQLIELLRQQGRIDETRLQVVSTLLNLANQVIKTGQVSLMDYKQALMFHLMHTRR